MNLCDSPLLLEAMELARERGLIAGVGGADAAPVCGTGAGAGADEAVAEPAELAVLRGGAGLGLSTGGAGLADSLML